VKQSSNSIPSGDLKDGTAELPQDSQSTNAASTPAPESQNTSDTSDTTVEAKSPKGSQRTPNSQDAPNAARLIQALGAKLGTLVEWKRLTLKDGRQVYALIFPTDKWHVDPKTKELLPR
jgi:hypothetical protein